MTDTKRTMTVWVVISDSDCGPNGVAHATARAAYTWMLSALESYMDDDGKYPPHAELRATLRAALAAENWPAFELAVQAANDNDKLLLIDTLYVERQEMELPELPDNDGGRTAAGNTPACDSCGLTHSSELDCKEVSDADKETVLAAARDAQDAFWRALSDLEAVIGHAVDGSQDLHDATLQTLAAE